MREHPRVLVAGYGEIGRALYMVLLQAYSTAVVDPPAGIHSAAVETPLDFLHICFPYSDGFISAVKDYQAAYKPAYTVIHSSVPVGTSRKCDACHSPVMGKHPDLRESLTTFTKFVGGPDAGPVIAHLSRAGVPCYPFPNPNTTELMKLLSTAFYGVCIEFTREVEALCNEAGAPFSAWTLWTEAYNKGYMRMGIPEYTRPSLIPPGPGPLGGHCLYPNARLLGDNDFTRIVLRYSDREEG